jgi:hypothetical protein
MEEPISGWVVECVDPGRDKHLFYTGVVNAVPVFTMHYAALFYVEAEADSAVAKLGDKFGVPTVKRAFLIGIVA